MLSVAHVMKKHDIIWHVSVSVWQPVTQTFAPATFNQNDFETQFNQQARSTILQFVEFVWMQKMFMLAKDVGCFAAFIQTAVPDSTKVTVTVSMYC